MCLKIQRRRLENVMENCCKIVETVLSMTRHIAENSGVHLRLRSVKPPHVLVKTALVASVGVDGNTRATVAPRVP